MEKRQLTANDLRKLAEAVDGIRDETAYVVWGNAGPEVRTQRPVSDEVIFECMTKNAEPKRAKMGTITLERPVIGSDGKPLTNFAKRFDAMFWSEAAVEKFMFPYYARFSNRSQMDSMRTMSNQQSVVAALHMPDSPARFLAEARDGKTFAILTPEELEAER
ncbi:MAG: hypothetical protein ABI026_10590 [Gemmatimonadaceae bacterium]